MKWDESKDIVRLLLTKKMGSKSFDSIIFLMTVKQNAEWWWWMDEMDEWTKWNISIFNIRMCICMMCSFMMDGINWMSLFCEWNAWMRSAYCKCVCVCVCKAINLIKNKCFSM